MEICKWDRSWKVVVILLLKVQILCGGNVYVGPEIYHIKRMRDSGSWQSGTLIGVRTGFDCLTRCNAYFGADYLYATGEVCGESRSNRELLSDLKDQIYEFRVGYQFVQCGSTDHFFLPFLGYGYFREINDFKEPSPLPYRLTETFEYIVTGFFAGVNFSPLLSMGLNGKVRFSFDGRSKISDDPFLDEDITLKMKEQMQFRLELPIRLCCWRVAASLVPFYAYRHFGGREGFPFNFVDTQFNLYGARLEVGYRF